MQNRQKKQSERERNRERERRTRGSRKYGQAKLKHSKRGILSCAIAGAVVLSVTISLMTAYNSAGEAGAYIGGIGLVTMILAGVGIYAAIRGFKEREKDYRTCKVGLGCNIFFLVSLIAIFCRGLF